MLSKGARRQKGEGKRVWGEKARDRLLTGAANAGAAVDHNGRRLVDRGLAHCAHKLNDRDSVIRHAVVGP